MTPPMTAMAMGERNSLPMPRPSAVGSMPSTMARGGHQDGAQPARPGLADGRRRRRRPRRMCCSAPSTSRMAFLVTSPMSRMRPMSEPMLMDLAGERERRGRRPPAPAAATSMMVNGWMSDSNWLASTMKMKTTATPQRHAHVRRPCPPAPSACRPRRRSSRPGAGGRRAAARSSLRGRRPGRGPGATCAQTEICRSRCSCSMIAGPSAGSERGELARAPSGRAASAIHIRSQRPRRARGPRRPGARGSPPRAGPPAACRPSRPGWPAGPAGPPRRPGRPTRAASSRSTSTWSSGLPGLSLSWTSASAGHRAHGVDEELRLARAARRSRARPRA